MLRKSVNMMHGVIGKFRVESFGVSAGRPFQRNCYRGSLRGTFEFQERGTGSSAPLWVRATTDGEPQACSSSPSARGGRSSGRASAPPGGSLVDVNPPRGTRDFFPDDKRLQTWLFDKFRSAAGIFGFEPVDFPVLESEALFKRKAGEEIAEQLYGFEDRGGRRVALRPELTPSLARLILRAGAAVPRPLKWYSIGQCWRYERSTRGRRREHYQWNMDIIGVSGVAAEAELLAAIVALLTSLGLTSQDVVLRVSSRKLLAGALASRGVADDAFSQVAVIVDKLDKLPRDTLVTQLCEASNISEADAGGLLDLLSLTGLPALEAALGEGAPGLNDLRELLATARAYGYDEWLRVDAGVVRGLAYYTGIVFEGADAAGQLRAVCGGGRYDGLLGTFGGAAEPAVGFGFGDAVIVELLRDRDLLPVLPHVTHDVVAALEDAQHGAAVALASRLRARGRSVDLLLERKRLKWILKVRGQDEGNFSLKAQDEAP